MMQSRNEARRRMPAGAKIAILIMMALALVYGGLIAGAMMLSASSQEPTRVAPPPPSSAERVTEARGLGWSMADVQAEWGEDRGWVWFDNMAAHPRVDGALLIAEGDARNLSHVVAMCEVPRGTDPVDFAVRMAGGQTVMAKLLDADAMAIADWFRECLDELGPNRREFARPFGEGRVLLVISDRDGGGVMISMAALP